GRRADRGAGPAAADLHPERDRADLLRNHPAQGQRGLRRRQFQGAVREHRARPGPPRSPLTAELAILDEAAVMAVLETVPDPEIPVLSIMDLGIVRGLALDPPRVLISPTYTGC